MENTEYKKELLLAQIELAAKGLNMAKDKDSADYFYNKLVLAVEKLRIFTVAGID